MTECERIERSIEGDFRDALWVPFTRAVDTYGLIRPGDRVAACISGGKDSMLMAKLLQRYQQTCGFDFGLVFLIMDPGYNPENRQRVESNARLLGLPYTLFESDIFDVANAQEKNPCFLCARMRRGTLYGKARELGCGKIALGHHFDDVIETTLIAMLYGAQLQAMPPCLQAKNFPGMSLIRPLYMVREEDIIAWSRANGLQFIQCACRFTENAALHEGGSKRQEVKQLLRRLREEIPDVEQHIFAAIHHPAVETLPGWKSRGVHHSYLERLEEE